MYDGQVLRSVRKYGRYYTAARSLDTEKVEDGFFFLQGPFLTKRKITIRDIFVVNRDFFVTIHDKRSRTTT